jgi:putative nucleotidyltransferase-like protein
MVEQEQTYASIILRLLLDRAMPADEQQQIIWGDLLHIAAQNGVLIRVVDQLETIGLEPRHFFSAAVKEMRARNQRNLSLIFRLGEKCAEANVDFIFPKVFQNYPDMPGDIDLHLAQHSSSVDATILAGLHARPLKRNLRNRIEGTANYLIRGCESVLEIHHGRIGMLGEHTWYTSKIIENSKYIRVEADEFLMPSPEDQLILQALQRVVQRSYLRLSDVVCTIDLLRRNALNWNYIFRAVNDLNIVYGLTCYLSFVEQIHRETFHSSLLPARLIRPVERQKWEQIEFKNGFYRFPRLKVGSRGYVNKFCSAVIAENWAVARRLSLLPVLALTTIVRKVRTS